jgi:MoxR-like ATPase
MKSDTCMSSPEVLGIKLSLLKNRLESLFVDRDREVVASLASLVSGEPAIFISPPGTGKTKLIEILSELINARYFYYLLTKFTEPDELIGPVDIAYLRKGKYVRLTKGRLPEAEVVFLDEIFRASSAIRNFLLDIILYKRIYNGSEYIKAPILTIYTASNEVSQENEDAALYDRFTIRDFYGPVGFDSWRQLLEKGLVLEIHRNNFFDPVLSADEIRTIQEKVKQRAFENLKNETLINKYLEVLAELKSSGVELSDRRKVKALIVASAISFIYREGEISLESLGDAIRFTAPSTEDDLKKIEDALVKAGLTSYEYRVRQLKTLETELNNIMARVKAVPADSNIRALNDVLSKSINMVERVGNSERLESYKSSLRDKIDEAKELLSQLKGESAGNA